MYNFHHHQSGLGMALDVTPTEVLASRSCDRQDPKNILCIPKWKSLAVLPGGRRRRRRTQHRCVLPWKPRSIDAPSIAKQILFCVCSFGFFFPPLATIRWYRCLVFVTLQPSQKLGRITEPLKKTELCGLRSVNGQEEGRRELVAVQGGGWKRSCLIPRVSGRHSHCFLGKTQGGELTFLSHLLGIDPGNGHLSQQCVRGQWKRRATVCPGPAVTIPQHFTSKLTF